MPRYIAAERLRSAILGLAQWRADTHSQGSKHLFPILSLLARGVNTTGLTRYEEADDFAFWNDYFRVVGDDADPYFDPLTLQRRIATHPHSNVATARKGTFENSWGAAHSQVVQQPVAGGPAGATEAQTQWRLDPSWPATVVQRVMTKGGEVTRAPVVDIAAWLFRQDEFPDNATAQTLQQRFRETFPLDDATYTQLFVFDEEPLTRGITACWRCTARASTTGG